MKNRKIYVYDKNSLSDKVNSAIRDLNNFFLSFALVFKTYVQRLQSYYNILNMNVSAVLDKKKVNFKNK